MAGLAVLLVQITYGAFTAGLKAGYVSDSWPLMFGRWIPQGLLRQVDPAALNLVGAPLTVAFIHRWFGVVALVAAAVAYRIIKLGFVGAGPRVCLALVFGLGLLQVGLGIVSLCHG